MQDPTSPGSLPEWIQTGSIVTAMAAFIVGGFREMWVFGSYHRSQINDWKERYAKLEKESSERIAKAEKERDEWQDRAWGFHATAKEAVQVAAKAQANSAVSG